MSQFVAGAKFVLAAYVLCRGKLECSTMHLGLGDAVNVYARGCRAWYGNKARDTVLKTADNLRKSGDLKGAEVWEMVASELETIGEPTLRSAFR